MVSKWIYTVESARGNLMLQDDERHLISEVSTMLERAEGLPSGDSRTLAARLLRYWASFYDDTWVWASEIAQFLIPSKKLTSP